MIYETVCRRYGIDPAGFLDDDYLAFQLRLALYWANRPSDPDAPGEQEQALTDDLLGAIHGG